MPISDILGLSKAVKNVYYDKNIYKRHHIIAEAVRKAVTEAGLSMYPEAGFSDTVTAINVPETLEDGQILSIMKNDYNILITGSFDILAGKVIRIGHMGENANIRDVAETLLALDRTFAKLGYPLKAKMSEIFMNEMENSELLKNSDTKIPRTEVSPGRGF